MSARASTSLSQSGHVAGGSSRTSMTNCALQPRGFARHRLPPQQVRPELPRLSLRGGKEDAGGVSLRGGARPLAPATIARMWLQTRAGAVLAVVAFLACDTGGPAAPTTPPVAAPTLTLSGEVHSNRFAGPLAGARVQASGRQTTTGEDGRYAVDGLSGVVVVTVAYTGHVPANATVTMDRDQTADFALEPGAPPFEGTAFIAPRLL